MASDLIPAPPRARELTKEEHDAWVAQAFADQQAIKEGLGEARSGLWKAASALYRFSENSGWLALGYETVGEWLADPDITMSRATYFRMTQAWRELVVIRKLPSPNVETLDLTKVTIVLPALKAASVNLDDAISDVESLGARDLREKYAQPGMVAIGDTTHTPTGDGLPDDPTPISDEPPILEVNGVVKREVAMILFACLARVRRELGDPQRKVMSGDLRNAIEDALIYAEEEGVRFDG